MPLQIDGLGRVITTVDWAETPGLQLDSFFNTRLIKLLRPIFKTLQEDQSSSVQNTKECPEAVYELSSGTNVLRPPSVILNALKQDAEDWHYLTSYSNPIGKTVLRGAVLLYEEAINDRQLSPLVTTIITAGGAEALRLLFRYLAQLPDPVGKVLIAGPQYQVIFQAICAAHIAFQELISGEPERFLPTPEEIKTALRTTKSQALLLTEPNNPSGEQHSLEEFADILVYLKQHGIYLLLDKVSADITAYPSIETLQYGQVVDQYDYWDHTFIVDSLSKRRAVSGLRFGYLIGEAGLAKFVYEQHIGSCPPNVAVEGITRDLFYSAYLSSSRQKLSRENVLSSLDERLQELTHGASRGIELTNMQEIHTFALEIKEMYATIYENKQIFSDVLAPWIVREMPMSSGFNYLVALRTPPDWDEMTFCKSLFRETRVAAYPLFYFISDPHVISHKRLPGLVWLRISCALPVEEFRICITRTREFLEKHSAF